MEQAQIQHTPDGAIVFDAAAVAQASFDPAWFDPAHWRAGNAAQSAPGGRGGALFIAAAFGNCALRHYRRGGMAARLLGDHYFWRGARATRSFAEFELLQALRGVGLRVPQPIAARFRRCGMLYRADIITRRIEHAQTLAELAVGSGIGEDEAARVGAGIATFHAQGAYHADLNAHNVLLAGDQVWLIDFDRGRMREPQTTWQLSNLARLQRSLRKVGADRDGESVFRARIWQPLLEGYQQVIGR